MSQDEENNKDKEKAGVAKAVDKVIIGAVIGGAIGSVLGITLAPQKGESTRKAISEKTKGFVTEHKGEIDTAKKLTKETAIGVFRLIRNRIKKK